MAEIQPVCEVAHTLPFIHLPAKRDPGAGIGEKNRVERILMSF